MRNLFSRFKDDRSLVILSIFAVMSFIVKLSLLYMRWPFLYYDETYYLLLSRNLFSGAGYTLNGLNNICFPPFVPVLIGILTFLFSNSVFSFYILSAVSGALLVFPVYFIAVRIFDKSTGLLASILICVIPALNPFLNLHGDYAGILYVGSEMLYCFLILLCLYFGYRGITRNRIADHALSGVFFGLAFLTRPEAVIPFLLMFSLAMVKWFIKRSTRSNPGFIIMFLVFCITILPYIIYLNTITGKWILSGKQYVTESVRTAMPDVYENNDWKDFISVHYRFDSKNNEMASPYWGVDRKAKLVNYKDIKTPGYRAVSPALKNLHVNIKNYIRGMTILYPAYLWIFIFFGFMSVLMSIMKKKFLVYDLFFLMLPFAASLCIALYLYVVPRHHIFIVPFLCLLAARGILLLCSLIRKETMRKLCIILIICAIFSLSARQVLSDSFISGKPGQLEKAKGYTLDYVLAEQLSRYKPDVIMSWHPGIAFYAGADWQVMPFAKTETIINFALSKKVDFIVFSKLSGSVPYDFGDSPQPYTVYDIRNLKPYYKDNCSMDNIGIRSISNSKLYRVYVLTLKGEKNE